MTSDVWLHLANCTTTGVLLMLLLWQSIPVAESDCVSDVCFCFPEGDIECAEIYLRRVPRFTRSEDNTTYSQIDLSQNRLQRLDRRSFRHLRVLSVKIWQNRGTLEIDGRALRPLNDLLQVVSMRKNRIPELPSGLFRKQRQLKEIDLPRNEISVIHRGVFRGASAVEVINLERNLLKRLEENVFAGLISLKQLYLARNGLVLIDPKAFRALRQLEVLDLKANRLRDLIFLVCDEDDEEEDDDDCASSVDAKTAGS